MTSTTTPTTTVTEIVSAVLQVLSAVVGERVGAKTSDAGSNDVGVGCRVVSWIVEGVGATV